MVNKSVFPAPVSQKTSARFPQADTVNEAGGVAYSYTPKHALAQFVGTGTFNGTYYSDEQEQLKKFLELSRSPAIDDAFIAKTAIWGREKGYMKDTPAACLMALAQRNNMELFHKVFDRVVDNGKMLRNVFTMLRSGVFGRRGMGYSIQRAFSRYFNTKSPNNILAASIGNDPTLRDILRMARPTPVDASRSAMFAWAANKTYKFDELPAELQNLLNYRTAVTEDEQIKLLEGSRYRWDLLADQARGPEVWKSIAQNMGHQALRMNLNTLQRHGVLNDKNMVNYVADKVGNPDEVRKARQFPYQYFSAYMNAESDIPSVIRNALNSAAETACGNIPELPGPIVIGVDVSGSMSSSITGSRGYGATSKMRVVDAAAVYAAALLRRNPDSLVVPFDDRAHTARFDPSDAILSIAKRLAAYGGGGTDCHLPIGVANQHPYKAYAGVVILSDNASWVTPRVYHWSGNVVTKTVDEFDKFVQNQKKLGVYKSPKLLNINLQPYGSAQTPERKDIINLGGLGDQVFNLISAFLNDDANRFVQSIEATDL